VAAANELAEEGVWAAAVAAVEKAGGSLKVAAQAAE